MVKARFMTLIIIIIEIIIIYVITIILISIIKIIIIIIIMKQEGLDSYLGNALFTHCPLTESTTGASRAEEAKSGLHAEETYFSFGHVLLDCEIKGQGL